MTALPPVPHLTTALSGPLLKLESELLNRQTDIESWFDQQWDLTPPPFYSSVDLRNAGFKLAPVDTNLFPAGFNNLNPAFNERAVQGIRAAMERACSFARGIVLVPEKHTRNTYYLENLATLAGLIESDDFRVRIGSIAPEITEATTFDLPSGKSLLIEPLVRREHEGKQQVGVGDFFPCAVLLNNDLSGGLPEILRNISQPVLPPLALGWNKRLKSAHFAEYRNVAVEFAELLNIDSWLIDPLFANCGQVDFKDPEGNECLRSQVGTLLKKITEKYAEYGIDQEPFVIVKADAGTYGMGIMVARSEADVTQLNRKQRNKMASSKEGNTTNSVIIQEGVYTMETVASENGPATAEPVVYMIDSTVAGGFYRVHTGKGQQDNLNAPGAEFRPLSFAEPCDTPDCSQEPNAEPNRFYAYGVIARLAALAAAREIAPHAKSSSTVVDNAA